MVHTYTTGVNCNFSCPSPSHKPAYTVWMSKFNKIQAEWGKNKIGKNCQSEHSQILFSNYFNLIKIHWDPGGLFYIFMLRMIV